MKGFPVASSAVLLVCVAIIAIAGAGVAAESGSAADPGALTAEYNDMRGHVVEYEMRPPTVPRGQLDPWTEAVAPTA